MKTRRWRYRRTGRGLSPEPLLWSSLLRDLDGVLPTSCPWRKPRGRVFNDDGSRRQWGRGRLGGSSRGRRSRSIASMLGDIWGLVLDIPESQGCQVLRHETLATSAQHPLFSSSELEGTAALLGCEGVLAAAATVSTGSKFEQDAEVRSPDSAKRPA